MQSTKSFFGWVDFTDEDQKRAEDYLRSLSEGTLDELGFGIIRDGFADRFFPATSTIMTRARYFVLVPSIYLRVLEQGDFGVKAKRKCDRLELALRKQLIANKAIANWRKEEVKRYPASIYWAGLRRLGIVNRQIGSQAAYFDASETVVKTKDGVKDDDHNPHEAEQVMELWDPEMVRLFESHSIPRPDGSGLFEQAIDFKLTRVESEYLRQRFLKAETDSVVANVFQRNTFVGADYPWQWDYPESLRVEINHAQHFSMLTKIATLLYYQLLDRKRVENGRTACEIDFKQSIEVWWTQCRERLAEWDIERFAQWTDANGLSRGSDKHFFKTLHRMLGELASSKDLIESKKVSDLIVLREKDKRPNKRRLIPGRFQNEWKLPAQRSGFFTDPKHVPYLLDFRSGIASQIVGDIFEGLKQQ